MENIIKLTIKDGHKVNEYEGYTVIGGVILLPIADKPVIQVITPFAHGRASIGDWCSMIEVSITMARQQFKLRGVPAHIYQDIIEHAIKEGLSEKED